MIATACDVGGSFGPLGCSRHVVSAATRPTATTGENRVMREPMAHLWPGAYLPRRSRALEVGAGSGDRKSTRLNSSHGYISYAVFCLKKKKKKVDRYKTTTNKAR